MSALTTMGRSGRVKCCECCGQLASVLYRVKYDESGKWIFVCNSKPVSQELSCWSSLSQNNPHYVYGGTWKAQKKY